MPPRRRRPQTPCSAQTGTMKNDLFFQLLLLIVTLDEATIKHLMYTQKVPFLYTERACVLFSRFSNSPRKIFNVERSVAIILDQREYKTGEYKNLTNEEKEELKEWRANNPNTSKAGSKKAKKEVPKKSKSSMKKQVASLVEAALNKSVKFDDQVNDEEKYIMSMVQAAVTKTLEQKNDQKSQENPKSL